MPLIFNQYLKIRNARLQVVSTSLNFLVAVFCAFQFFHFRQYGRLLPVTGRVSMWVAGNTDASHLNSFKVSAAGSALCSSSVYDFQNDLVNFQSHSCISACSSPWEPPESCLALGETAIQEAADSLLFVTHMQQTTYSSAQRDVRNYFVPSAEALSAQLFYGFTAPNLKWWQMQPGPGAHSEHSSLADTSTVLLDHMDKKVGVIPAGEAINITLGQLLTLSGHGSLDDQKWGGGINRISGGTLNPSIRLSGVDLTLELECGTVKTTEPDGAPASSCNLRVKSTPATWAFAAPVALAGLNVQRTYRGVRVRTVLKGKQLSLDINSIFINIASAIVMFQFPKAVVFVIAVFCCGHVSTIYRQLVYRDFSISKEVSAMAMRLLEHEVAFNELEQSDDQCSPAGYIAKGTMSASLGHLLEKRGQIDETEKSQMVNFCLANVSKEFSHKHDGNNSSWQLFLAEAFDGVTTIVSDIREAFGLMPKPTFTEDGRVDVDNYVGACSSAEPMSFSSIVKLFDVDRKISFMENLFMPMTLKANLHHVKQKSSKRHQVFESSVSSEALPDFIEAFPSNLCAIKSETSQKREKAAKRQLPEIRADISTLQNDLKTSNSTIDQMSETISDLTKEFLNLKTQVLNLEKSLTVQMESAKEESVIEPKFQVHTLSAHLQEVKTLLTQYVRTDQMESRLNEVISLMRVTISKAEKELRAKFEIMLFCQQEPGQTKPITQDSRTKRQFFDDEIDTGKASTGVRASGCVGSGATCLGRSKRIGP